MTDATNITEISGEEIQEAAYLENHPSQGKAKLAERTSPKN